MSSATPTIALHATTILTARYTPPGSAFKSTSPMPESSPPLPALPSCPGKRHGSGCLCVWDTAANSKRLPCPDHLPEVYSSHTASLRLLGMGLAAGSSIDDRSRLRSVKQGVPAHHLFSIMPHYYAMDAIKSTGEKWIRKYLGRERVSR